MFYFITFFYFLFYICFIYEINLKDIMVLLINLLFFCSFSKLSSNMNTKSMLLITRKYQFKPSITFYLFAKPIELITFQALILLKEWCIQSKNSCSSYTSISNLFRIHWMSFFSLNLTHFNKSFFKSFFSKTNRCIECFNTKLNTYKWFNTLKKILFLFLVFVTYNYFFSISISISISIFISDLDIEMFFFLPFIRTIQVKYNSFLKTLKSFSFFYDICLKYNTIYNWRWIIFFRTLFYRTFVGRVIGKLYYINVCYCIMSRFDNCFNSINKEHNFKLIKHNIITELYEAEKVYNSSFEETNDYLNKLNKLFFIKEIGTNCKYRYFIFFHENIAILNISSKRCYIPYVCYISEEACEVAFNKSSYYHNIEIRCEYLIDNNIIPNDDSIDSIDSILFCHILKLLNNKYKYRLHLSNIINIIIKSQICFNKQKQIKNLNNPIKRFYSKSIHRFYNTKKYFHKSMNTFLPLNKIKPFLFNGFIIHKQHNKSFIKHPVIKKWISDLHIVHFIKNTFNNGYFNINGVDYVLTINLSSNKTSDLVNIVDHLSPFLEKMNIYNSLVLLTKEEYLSFINNVNFTLASDKIFYKNGYFIKNPDLCLNELVLNYEFNKLLKNVYIKDFNGKEVKGTIKTVLLGSLKMYYTVYHFSNSFLNKKEFNIIDHPKSKNDIIVEDYFSNKVISYDDDIYCYDWDDEPLD